MKKEDRIHELQEKFLNGTLNEEEDLELRIHFETGGETDNPFFKDYFDYLMAYEQETTKQNIPVVQEKMSSNISRFRTLWSAAAAVLLLIIGFIGGKYKSGQNYNAVEVSALRSDIEVLKKEMVLMQIDMPLASDRLRAVQSTETMNTEDSELIKALGKALVTDEDINVRLAAAYTLFGFSDNDEAKRLLVEAIDSDTQETLVQLSLINMMFILQEKSSLPRIRKVLSNNDIPREDQMKIESQLTEWL